MSRATSSPLFILEAVACLLPAIFSMIASSASYFFLLWTLPDLLMHPQAAVLQTFSLITAMLGGGYLGLFAIGMALYPEVLQRNRTRKKLALVFACAGLAAELLYVHFEGLRHVLTNAFSIWMLIGPMVFGIHLLYRNYSIAQPSVIAEP
jgi:uncharacterized membrane protein YpjA